jgi:hypothetical protein
MSERARAPDLEADLEDLPPPICWRCGCEITSTGQECVAADDGRRCAP